MSRKVEEPYFIEVESNGCSHCAAGRTWGVVGPDGVMGGRSFADEDDASELAEALNEAYWAGRAALAASAPASTPEEG
jgi:predicted DNA-binding WGR domain protein